MKQVWVPVVSVKCKICDSVGRKFVIFNEYNTWFDPLYAFRAYKLCWLCYDTVISHYTYPVNIKQLMAFDDRWTRRELTNIEFYISREEVKQTLYKKYISVEHNLFPTQKQNRINYITKLNNIYYFKILKYDPNSRIKYLLEEIINIIISFL
jgi:hypothetical protein